MKVERMSNKKIISFLALSEKLQEELSSEHPDFRILIFHKDTTLMELFSRKR